MASALMAFTALVAIQAILLSNPAVGQWKTQTWGDRQTYVHLFEWKWRDIANECENFLAKYKYGAIQISPPNEHLMNTLYNKESMPWFVRYQPVSYRLDRSRGGTFDELKDMINRCNNVGVRYSMGFSILRTQVECPLTAPGVLQLGVRRKTVQDG